MGFYNIDSKSSDDVFRERIRRIRDLMHPNTIPKYRRHEDNSDDNTQSMEFYKESINVQNSRKTPVEQNNDKSKLHYDEETFKKLLGK